MDDKVNQVPDQVDSDPVTVQAGSKEGVPASVESSIKNVENYIQPSEVEPQVSNEEAKAGVEVVHSDPKLHPDAVSMGLEPSIPKAPNYTISSVDMSSANQVVEKGEVTDANIWRILIDVLKQQKEALTNLLKSKPTEQKPV